MIFLVQKRPFFQLFFQAIQTSKMSFTTLQIEKTPFQAIKTRSSKTRKSDIFLRGLTHGVGQKMAIFPTFFQYRPPKCFFAIFQNEKMSSQGIKTRSSNSRKMDIFQRGQPIVFFIVRHREIGRLDHKNIDYKNSENLDFSKGVSLWFFSKNVIFLILSFCSKYAKIKVRNDVLHT